MTVYQEKLSIFSIQIRDKKQYSTLTSGPMEVQQTEQCGEFYYNIYGHPHECDYARFLVTLECEGENPTELFRTTGSEKEKKWNRVRVTIKKAPGTKCKVRLQHSESFVFVIKIFIYN